MNSTATPTPAALPVAELLPAPLLIVEDDQLMQARMRGILQGLGYADDALLAADDVASARVVYAEQPCAMALVDIRLPDGSGIDLIRDWHKCDPALPMLVISAWSTGSLILSALQAGATGYVLKERDDLEISLSIRSALRGGAPIDPFVAHHILEITANDLPPDASVHPAGTPVSQGKLSRREIDILVQVNKGMTNKEIADSLGLSKLTVECYTKNIYKKLAVRSRTEAAFVARERGLLP